MCTKSQHEPPYFKYAMDFGKNIFLHQTKIIQSIDMYMKIIMFVTTCKIIDHGVGGVANNIGWDVFCGAYWWGS